MNFQVIDCIRWAKVPKISLNVMKTIRGWAEGKWRDQKYREIGGPRQIYKRVKRVLHYKKRLDDSDFKKSTA